MRVLQINPNGSDASALDLHPTISVVTGLGPSGRDTVVRAFRAMAQGTDPGCGGLLEAHGVLFDLSAESIGMLDLSARVGVIVDADEIAAVGSGTSPLEAPTFDRAQIDQFLEETPEGEHPDLDAARRTRDDARTALTILTEAADKAHVKYDEVETELRRAQAELEVARSSVPRLRLVTEDDADADADDTEVVSADELRAMHADLQAELDAFEARGAQIARGLRELSSIDIRPLNVLLDAIRSPSPVELVPSERAQELADDVKLLEARVGELERELDDQGMGTAAVMQRLEECRADVASAERSMKKPELGPADVEELEAAHEAVLEAEQKASSGLFKGGARKALDEAVVAQQRVLDRVGFPTWTAYVMGASLLSIDPIAEQRLEKARLDLESAEEHWARITQAIESNPEHRNLLNKLEEVYLEAYDLLGGEEPEDLETALRTLQVPKREVTTEELADALAYQLELLGLPLGDKPSVDLVVMAADAFVEEAMAITGRIAELRGEQARIDAELAAGRVRLAELPPLPEPEPEPEPEPLPAFGGFASFDDAPADGAFGSFEGLASPSDEDGTDGGGEDGGFESFGSFQSFLSEPGADETDDEPGAQAGSGGSSGSGDDGFGGFVSFDSFPSLVPDGDEDEAADAADGGGDLYALFGGELSDGDGSDDGDDVNDELVALGADEEDEVADEDDEDDVATSAADDAVDAAAVTEAAEAAATASDHLADLERRVEIATEEEDEYREWVESRDALVETALQIETVATTKVVKIAVELLTARGDWATAAADPDGIPDADAVTSYLHERLGELRHVSFAGSVPLVLDDALSALPAPDVRRVLGEIERDAATVQIVYLTDDPDLVGWADEVGFQRAAVVDAPAALR